MVVFSDIKRGDLLFRRNEMAITITIQEKEPRDDNRQIVFFTVTKDGKDYEFSHGAVPASLTTDTQIKNWLIARKDEIWKIIQRKIDNGTFKNNHPKWVKAIAEIDAISSLADAKVFLKKLVRYLGK